MLALSPRMPHSITLTSYRYSRNLVETVIFSTNMSYTFMPFLGYCSLFCSLIGRAGDAVVNGALTRSRREKKNIAGIFRDIYVTPFPHV